VNAKVIVVCDNPRHAGKVAKVSTFDVADGEIRLRDDGRRPLNRRETRKKVDPSNPKFTDYDEGGAYFDGFFYANGGTNEIASCNLCGCTLPDDPRVYRAVEFIATRDGYEHTASLSDVAATISKLEA